MHSNSTKQKITSSKPKQTWQQQQSNRPKAQQQQRFDKRNQWQSNV